MSPEVQQEVAPVTPQPPAEQPPQLSQAEMFKLANERREQFWRNNQDGERMQRARRKGLFGPSIEPTHEELIAAVPLPEDKIKFLHVATDRFGLPAMPKPKGRKRPHMTKRDQAVKSASIIIFRSLFSRHIIKLEAVAKEKGEQFNGVPNDDIPKLGARAAVLGVKAAKLSRKERRKMLRRRSELSRKINFGLIPGNTNVARYIN